MFVDVRYGDLNEVIISGTALTVRPTNSTESWELQAKMDPMSCSAYIDFSKAIHERAPPVTLLATVLHTASSAGQKMEILLADPTGGAAPVGEPVRLWVQTDA